jgi:hypothetical protein
MKANEYTKKWRVLIKDLYYPSDNRTVIVEAHTMEAAWQAVELGESEIITFVHHDGHCPYDGKACDAKNIPYCRCITADYYQSTRTTL